MMKKIQFLLIGLMFIMPCSLFAQNYVYGDVNGDGEVSVADVTRLIDYILGHEEAIVSLEVADVNDDGEVSVADVTRIIDLIIKGAK